MPRFLFFFIVVVFLRLLGKLSSGNLIVGHLYLSEEPHAVAVGQE